MLEFWVDLGEEMEVICWVLDALVLVEWKRKRRAEFAEEERDDWVALGCSGCSLSQDDKRQ